MVNYPCITTLVSFFFEVLKANINCHGCFSLISFLDVKLYNFLNNHLQLVIVMYVKCKINAYLTPWFGPLPLTPLKIIKGGNIMISYLDSNPLPFYFYFKWSTNYSQVSPFQQSSYKCNCINVVKTSRKLGHICFTWVIPLTLPST